MSKASQSYMVAAYFEKEPDAENALRELQAAGFRSNQIGTSFGDLDPEDGEDNRGPSKRTLTSDAYSPNSATETAAARHESFWDKVKDFFSGETADSDINDNSIVDRAHQNITDRGWRSSGIRVPISYHTRLNEGGGLVTVHSSDRVDEAEKILARNNGQVDRDFNDEALGTYELEGGDWAGTPGMAVSETMPNDNAAAGMGTGTRADINGGVPAPEEREENAIGSRSGVEKGVLSSINPGQKPAQPADAKRRIQMVSNALQQRNARAAQDKTEQRSPRSVAEEDDPESKIA